ncbi:MAG: universal stress protein [Cyanosarcina radialis HA8281-LM2]|jgi:nucleotide-binding universal stress UspA family protein|nr:universal stress protein [Cyanosarcina radialis HA8281-LM2]
MFRKILVALDRSDLAEYVVETAIAQAKAIGGNLLLLHVPNVQEQEFPQIEERTSGNYSPESVEAEVQSYERQWKIYEQVGLNFLQAYNERAIAAGIDADYAQPTGDLVANPGETICAVAEEWEADLIVIGHRGSSGVRELMLGSVSNYVWHHATCSVLRVQLPIVAKTEIATVGA